MEVLAQIPVTLDPEVPLRRFGPKEEEDLACMNKLVMEACAIGRPKAVYREIVVGEKGDNGVVLDGIRFTSRVLEVNLEKDRLVYPFVITAGTELDAWSEGIEDPLLQYWADGIKELILSAAVSYVTSYITDKYQTGNLATMNPGSLTDWPLPAQGDLFRLLGDVTAAIGVRLSPSFLMRPTKSVSGVYFPTDQPFVNCQLCPRAECPGRRALYDEHLYATRYGVGCGD